MFGDDIGAPFTDVFDIAAVADQCQKDGLVAGDPRAFQLDRVSVGRVPNRPFAAHGSMVEGGIAGVGHVQMPARFIEDERVGIFIEHMRRHGARGADRTLGQWRYGKARRVGFDPDYT